MKTKLFFIAFLTFSLSIQGFSQSNSLFEIGEKDSLYSKILDESRSIWIEYPSNFNPNSSRKYPVLYLLDGDALLDIVSTVHRYYSGGFIPEMIIVGIANNENRTRDLTTSKIEGFYTENGEAEKFTQFIEKELIPFIEKKHPVTQYRTLIGHSYGGLFTINTLIHHRDLFQNYLAIDPSLDWDNQKLLKASKDILSKTDYT
jgi:predicted alpha/beta superfamily hydrolase